MEPRNHGHLCIAVAAVRRKAYRYAKYSLAGRTIYFIYSTCSVYFVRPRAQRKGIIFRKIFNSLQPFANVSN